MARLGKKGRRLFGKLAAIARKKAKLPAVDWYDGELRSLENDGAVTGVLAFDIRRRTAREIAAAVGGVNQFVWGTSGAPVEAHDVKIFEDDGGHSWKASRAHAFAGLSDMAASALHIPALPMAVEESQTTMDKFWRLVAVVLGAAIAGGAVTAQYSAYELSLGFSHEWLSTQIIGISNHPSDIWLDT